MNKFSYEPTQYTHYRPQYPDELFVYLRKLVVNNDFVLDCGAGSGQATQGLAQHFRYVMATDLSFELLSQVKHLPNVCTIQSRAEQLPIRSNSLNLICIAQAMHWFSLDDFYHEVKRTVKSQGFIAAWCYNQTIIEPAIDFLINKVYMKISSVQNPSRERQYVYDCYQTIPFPFERLSTPNFTVQMNWNLIQLLGYINTWPGVLEYKKRFDVDIISEIQDEMVSAWGETSSKKSIIWPIYLLVGRVV